MKEIYEMKGAGRSIRGIAQELDVSRNTVRRYLKSPEAMRPRPRPPRGSKLDPYAEHIDRRMGEGLENCRVLDREVRALGYQGSYSTVAQYVRPRRQHKQPEAVRKLQNSRARINPSAALLISTLAAWSLQIGLRVNLSLPNFPDSVLDSLLRLGDAVQQAIFA